MRASLTWGSRGRTCDEVARVTRPVVGSAAVRARELKREVRTALLEWFDRSKRDLPWRAHARPLRRLGQRGDAAADPGRARDALLDEVPRALSHGASRSPQRRAARRARAVDGPGLLLARAQPPPRREGSWCERFGGELPDSVDALLTLPGFGRYTAGAVASIAFELEAPLVDGNVARVLSRLLEVDGVPGDKVARGRAVGGGRGAGERQQARRLEPGPDGAGRHRLRAPEPAVPRLSAAHGVPRPRARAGSTSCRGPRRRRSGSGSSSPSRWPGEATRCCWRGARRRASSAACGRCPPPSCTPAPTETSRCRSCWGTKASIGPELTVLERTLTHRDLVLRLHAVALPRRLSRPPPGYLEWRWVAQEDIAALGMSTAMQGALAEAG